MRSLQHEAIAPLINLYKEPPQRPLQPTTVYIVTRHYPTRLDKVVYANHYKIPELEILECLLQISKAVSFLHSKNYITPFGTLDCEHIFLESESISRPFIDISEHIGLSSVGKQEVIRKRAKILPPEFGESINLQNTKVNG